MTERHELPRSGRRALRFDGELMASASTWANEGPGNSRWWAIHVYSAGSPKQVVLALDWRTNWEKETGWNCADIMETVADAADALEAHDPLCKLAGYPPGQHFAARQRALEESVSASWGQAVVEIMAELGVAEEV